MKHFFLIVILFSTLKGCSSQKVYVYEKIPENMECHRFKKFDEIEFCDRKKRINLDEKIFNVIEKINSQ